MWLFFLAFSASYITVVCTNAEEWLADEDEEQNKQS